MAEKLVITAALTGSMTVPTQNPHLPFASEHLIADAEACVKAGASAVHVHARNPQTGQPSSDPDLFAPVLAGIHAKTDAVAGISTGGPMGQLPKDRLRAIPRYKPELASFNLGSMNFSMHPVAKRIKEWKYDWEEAYVSGTKDSIFRNTFGDMEVYSAIFAEHGTKPEFEAYDVSHLYNLRFMYKSGMVKAPFWIQFVLGVLGGIGATPEDLMFMKQTADKLFGDAYLWSVLAAGRHQMPFATQATMMGGNVRVGLEDSLFIGRGQLASSNGEQVAKIRRILEELGHAIATPTEAREILRLKGSDNVGF